MLNICCKSSKKYMNTPYYINEKAKKVPFMS